MGHHGPRAGGPLDSGLIPAQKAYLQYIRRRLDRGRLVPPFSFDDFRILHQEMVLSYLEGEEARAKAVEALMELD